MSLNVDPREGSKRLIEPLRDRGLAVTTERMDAGDVAWVGRGEHGRPVLVGLEYKTLGDLLQCFRDNRFAEHQLPGLQDNYDAAWLVVEGEWRPGPHGELVVRHGQRWGDPHGQAWRYLEVEGKLTTIEVRGGVNLRRSRSLDETVAMIHGLYAWWTSKDLDDHKSHLQFHDNKPLSRRVSTRRPTVGVKIAAQLPHIGWEGAWALQGKRYLGWGLREWAELRIGKRQARLGEKRGEDVWTTLRALL